ncbi:MAG: methionyl-tRNA formyltransferase [Chloroflexota bacterium]|nr:methionyl-tRNA formyltransferase [Chloroflexota bacterium]
MRVIFCGTAAFAVPSLHALTQRHDVVLVVTQQDRPAGRGRRPQMPPVKLAAAEHNLAVTQPRSLRKEAVVAELAAAAADVIVVAAYGKILPKAILDLPPHGCLNVHASLLPRHRGAAPVTAAIIAGDAESGSTIMHMDEGLDTGPILRQQSIPLSGSETTASLTTALSQLGADLLLPTVEDWVAGRIEPQDQDESSATYAPLLKKEDGIVRWDHDAESVCRHLRAMQPWPGAVTFWNGRQVKILGARPIADSVSEVPGRVIRHEGELAVVAGTGIVVLDEVQLAGKRALPAADFLRGYGAIVGAVLGEASMVS